MAECSNPDCGFPDTPCALRVEPGNVCPSLGRDPHAPVLTALPGSPASPPAPERTATDDRFWDGDVIPLDQAGPLLLARHPRLVLVVGLPGAGKTSLFVSQYLALSSPSRAAVGWRFCQSRTLRGYETLARGSAPTANPGLLHLAFKPRVALLASHVEDRVVDVALTDLRGETCAQWARNADRTLGLPLVRADHIWVVVDLPGAHRDRKARGEVVTLLDRVVEAAGRRPIALILVGARGDDDPGVTASTVERLSAPLTRHKGDSATFQVPFDGSPQAALGPLTWTLERPTTTMPLEAPPRGASYYGRFRESPPRLS